MRTTSMTLVTLAIAVLLGGATATLAAKGGGKGGGKDKPDDPSSDPAIVFTQRSAVSGPSEDLVVMNADGTAKTAIWDAEAWFPSWSPDGSQIAFASRINGDGIYVVDRDGSNARKVVDVQAASGSPVCWSPIAAPDGRFKIAYIDSTGSSSTPDEVFLVNTDGSGRTQLTDTPGVHYWDVTWSPTADALAVVAWSSDTSDVTLLDLGLVDGAVTVSSETCLTGDDDVPDGLLNDATYFAHVAWARTSDQLAVAVGLDGFETDIWLIDLADPARPVQLTNTPGSFNESGPTWAPDDSQLAFYDLYSAAIFVVNADGTSLTELAAKRGRGALGDPDWRRTP